jgi:hypothetical protein
MMYAAGFNILSDRNAKANFADVDLQAVLDRVSSLPVTEWSYKKDSKDVRHIGPMAQDFQAAFQLSSDDKHISVVDEGGVALAAIQGLNEKLKEKDAQVEALTERLSCLEKKVNASAQK